MLARFCRRMEKPAWPPMPRTGGGMMTVIFASSMSLSRADVVGDLVDGQPLLGALARVVEDAEQHRGWSSW